MGRKQRRRDQASGLGSKLPTVTPNAKCKLRLLKLERVKDWLLMEEEFVQNQERLRPQEERNKEDRSKVRRAGGWKRAGQGGRGPRGGRWAAIARGNTRKGSRHQPLSVSLRFADGRIPCWLEIDTVGALCASLQVDDLRGSPMSVGNLEEIIDEK